jgi:hypothetical protein
VPNRTARSSSTENTAAPAGPYLARLDPEDQEAYGSSSGSLDLSEEIRVIRVVLSRLTADIPANKQVIGSVFGALIRAISFQAGRSRGAEGLEKALQDASEQVLNDASADASRAALPEENSQ